MPYVPQYIQTSHFTLEICRNAYNHMATQYNKYFYYIGIVTEPNHTITGYTNNSLQTFFFFFAFFSSATFPQLSVAICCGEKIGLG